MKMEKKGDVWFVRLGVKYRHYDGAVTSQLFLLGTKKAVAKERAKRLWDLWTTQDGLWTQEGIKKGREISKGQDEPGAPPAKNHAPTWPREAINKAPLIPAPGSKEIQLGNGGTYFVRIGKADRVGTSAAYHFDLATDETISRDRAERIWKLWLTQGERWTADGLKWAREIARGRDKPDYQPPERKKSVPVAPPGSKEIQLGTNKCYFVKIGKKILFDGTGAAYHFPLATDEAVSKDRAERLWQLWLTQGEHWTQDGLKQAREIARVVICNEPRRRP